MKLTHFTSILILGLIALTSFQMIDTTGNFERPPLRKRYMDRMDKFHMAQQQKCREDAATVARLQVDSVLTGKKLLVQIDSFRLLPRPNKPIKPQFEFELDSSPVDPLFKKDQLNKIERN